MAGFMVIALLSSLAPLTVVAADPPGGLTVEQRDGFALLSWDPVPGAGEYEIHRQAVDEANVPTDDADLVGIWRPNRTVTPEQPTFADAGFNPGDRFAWQVRARFGSGLPFQVIVDAPSSAAGTYEANGSSFGTPADAIGISGVIVLGDDGTANGSLGCSPLVGFPAGAIALLDRGSCNFTVKALNAQNAGATAMILVNDRGGLPTNMTGTNGAITISSVMVSQDDGNLIKTGLAQTGTVRAAPVEPLSDPVYGTTLPQWGDPSVEGENLRTGWELVQAAQYTNDVDEYAYTAALDAASERIRVVEIGRTVLNRPINMFVIGYPAPPPTAEAVRAKPSAVVNCNVHGNEPSSREACLILARELAFGTDARTIDLLTNVTVLMVPAINGDGRAANSRGNSTGQDLNRDHSLLRQPETAAFAEMVRDYSPYASFDGHEYGNSNAGDLPVLPPRHLNVAQSIFDGSQDMITNWMYGAGSEAGWWYCPYGCQGGGNVGLGEETILRNTLGLKNTVNSLLEARSSGGATRPNEGSTQNNRRRKTYSALFTYQEFFDYVRANSTALAQARTDAIAFQISNSGEIIFRGTRPIPAFPAPHPGEAPPPQDTPTGNDILADPPCGYYLDEGQYNGPRSDGPAGMQTTVNQRLASHGWTVDTRTTGYIVRLAQPHRGLIPLLLDDQAAEEMVDGVRLYECPWITVDPAGLAAGTVEGGATGANLAINNIAVEPDQDLEWTITEASDDCSSPSDLGWVSTSTSAGTTGPGSSSNLGVTFDADGLSAPDSFDGLLCISTNDPGDPVVPVPVHFQVQYPFGGFGPPIEGGLDTAKSGSTIPVKFQIGGDRGLDAVASVASVRVDCDTLEPLGSAVAASSSSGLVWDGEKYQFDWKTSKAFAGTCRALVLELADHSDLVPNPHVAFFEFS
jgi:hypothetical protein